jgi:hypothetical protein
MVGMEQMAHVGGSDHWEAVWYSPKQQRTMFFGTTEGHTRLWSRWTAWAATTVSRFKVEQCSFPHKCLNSLAEHISCVIRSTTMELNSKLNIWHKISPSLIADTSRNGKRAVTTSATISRPPLINCSMRNRNTLASPLHDFLCDWVSIKERRLEGCRQMQDKTLSWLSLQSSQVRSLIGQHIHGMAHEVKQSEATSSIERGEGMRKAVETWSPNASQRWAAITAPHNLTQPSGKET